MSEPENRLLLALARILRNRAKYLVDVRAPDEKAAEAADVVEFKLSAHGYRDSDISSRMRSFLGAGHGE